VDSFGRTGPSVSARAPVLEIDAVIPCYNAADFIAEAIESVLAQTRPVRRLIVVDDASDDGTAAVVERFARAGPPVECLRLPVNGGGAAARNAGVLAGASPLIAFLDADDWWLPGHCATLAALLERHPESVLAFGGVESADPGPMEAARLPAGEPVDAFWPLALDNMIPHSTAMVRRTAFLAAGRYDPALRYAEDYDLWLRMGLLGPVVCAADRTGVRRSHPGQTSRDTLRMLLAAWRVRARARARFADAADAASLARYDSALCTAFDRDLRHAWETRSRATFLAILDAAPTQVQGIGEVARGWSRRLYLWPAWRLAAGVWDQLPVPLRATLRSPA
jgi:glycosyltransferase involved in cell wall biosynthesis